MAKAQAQEPSMEEILASIRRIIADEDTAPKKAAAVVEPVAEETISEDDLDKLFSSTGDDSEEDEEDDDVLELTEEVAPPEPMMPEPVMIEGLSDGDDLAFEEMIEEEPEPEPEPVKVTPPPPRVEPERSVARPPEPMVAPTPAPVIAAAPSRPVLDVAPSEVAPLVSRTTEGLVASAFDQLAKTVVTHNARTLEDLVQDMLRPMLKSWLDENLPGMVERLVKIEIERVTRGR